MVVECIVGEWEQGSLVVGRFHSVGVGLLPADAAAAAVVDDNNTVEVDIPAADPLASWSMPFLSFFQDSL